jgi:hypothetical protein
VATISTFALTSVPRDSPTVLSGEAASADVVELMGLPTHLTHVFLSVRFFDSGDLPVTPSGGTLTVEVMTQGNQPNWEDPLDDTIIATAPTTVDWAANTYGVRVTPSGLTGVDHWVAFIVMNKT